MKLVDRRLCKKMNSNLSENGKAHTCCWVDRIVDCNNGENTLSRAMTYDVVVPVGL